MMCEKRIFPYLSSLRDRVVILSLSPGPPPRKFGFFSPSTGKPEKGGNWLLDQQIRWRKKDGDKRFCRFQKLKKNNIIFRPECLLLLLLSSAQSADLLMQEADLSDVISSISISRIKSGGRMLSAGQFCPGFFIWLEIE